MIIEIITDGGSSFGLGHLRRSATLSWRLKESGYRARVTKATKKDIGLLGEVPKDHGVPDIVVIDLPYRGDQWVIQLKKVGIKSIGLDYMGEVAPDALINIVERNAAPNCPIRYTGLEFAIIREDITKLSPAETGSGIIVCIGAGDQLGTGSGIAEELGTETDDVTLIEGPLTKKNVTEGKRYQLIRNPKDLAVRFSKCHWAVTNGGASMMEMMCLGKAVYVMPQTRRELKLAHLILSRDGILGVGEQKFFHPNLKQIEKVSKIALKLVDGRGTDRIIEVIENLN